MSPLQIGAEGLGLMNAQMQSIAGSSLPARAEVAEAAIPGGWEIWLFVIGEMTIFMAMFATYAFYRSQDPAGFYLAQQEVHIGFGVVNTLLLLTSSMFVALAVRQVRSGHALQAGRWVMAGAACGVAFLCVKSVEWTIGISRGFTFNSNEYSTFYYMMCGLHLIHVLAGLVLLAIVWLQLRASKLPNMTFVVSSGIYWHMVDALWVMLFPLLFLLR